MSVGSSNRVRLAFIEETVYGETPVAGDFNTARFVSEALSGTPTTVESKQIRVDRMSSGQVVVGLGVTGQFQFELAKEDALDLLLASAMYSDWDVVAAVPTKMDIDGTLKTLTRSVGSFISEGLVAGDFLTLSNFGESQSNAQVMVVSVDSGTVLTWAGPVLATQLADQTFTAAATDIVTAAGHGMYTGQKIRVSSAGTLPAGIVAATDYYAIVLSSSTFKLAASLVDALAGTPVIDITDAGTGIHTFTRQTSYARADKLSIGVDKKSFSFEKSFTDLTDKAINYRGMLAANLDLKFAYGELATGSFVLSGNDYQTTDVASEFITDGRTVLDAATTQTLNGSVDMPFLASDAVGALETGSFDLQSVAIKLNNNLKAIEVIGDIAPIDYSEGTAQITVDLSAYLTDAAWSLLDKKLTQEPFIIAFQVKNSGGWYAVYLPAVQVSFPDPSSGGQNQDIILAMTGMAKVGANGESAMTIFRGPAA